MGIWRQVQSAWNLFSSVKSILHFGASRKESFFFLYEAGKCRAIEGLEKLLGNGEVLLDVGLLVFWIAFGFRLVLFWQYAAVDMFWSGLLSALHIKASVPKIFNVHAPLSNFLFFWSLAVVLDFFLRSFVLFVVAPRFPDLASGCVPFVLIISMSLESFLSQLHWSWFRAHLGAKRSTDFNFLRSLIIWLLWECSPADTLSWILLNRLPSSWLPYVEHPLVPSASLGWFGLFVVLVLVLVFLLKFRATQSQIDDELEAHDYLEVLLEQLAKFSKRDALDEGAVIQKDIILLAESAAGVFDFELEIRPEWDQKQLIEHLYGQILAQHRMFQQMNGAAAAYQTFLFLESMIHDASSWIRLSSFVVRSVLIIFLFMLGNIHASLLISMSGGMLSFGLLLFVFVGWWCFAQGGLNVWRKTKDIMLDFWRRREDLWKRFGDFVSVLVSDQKELVKLFGLLSVWLLVSLLVSLWGGFTLILCLVAPLALLKLDLNLAWKQLNDVRNSGEQKPNYKYLLVKAAKRMQNADMKQDDWDICLVHIYEAIVDGGLKEADLKKISCGSFNPSPLWDVLLDVSLRSRHIMRTCATLKWYHIQLLVRVGEKLKNKDFVQKVLIPHCTSTELWDGAQTKEIRLSFGGIMNLIPEADCIEKI